MERLLTDKKTIGERFGDKKVFYDIINIFNLKEFIITIFSD